MGAEAFEFLGGDFKFCVGGGEGGPDEAGLGFAVEEVEVEVVGGEDGCFASEVGLGEEGDPEEEGKG